MSARISYADSVSWVLTRLIPWLPAISTVGDQEADSDSDAKQSYGGCYWIVSESRGGVGSGAANTLGHELAD